MRRSSCTKSLRTEGNVVTVRVSGKLTQKDYDDLIPAWKKVIAKHGSMRMLFVMHDFHGWEPKAAWEDFSFDRAYSEEVERVAMVGEKSWQKWMTKIGSVFRPKRGAIFRFQPISRRRNDGCAPT